MAKGPMFAQVVDNRTRPMDMILTDITSSTMNTLSLAEANISFLVIIPKAPSGHMPEDFGFTRTNFAEHSADYASIDVMHLPMIRSITIPSGNPRFGR